MLELLSLLNVIHNERVKKRDARSLNLVCTVRSASTVFLMRATLTSSRLAISKNFLMSCTCFG